MAITLTMAAVVAVGAASTAYSASQAKSASNDQVQAAQNATQLQQAEFNTEQQNEAPWLSAGNQALQTLQAGSAPGGQFNQPFNFNYTASPGYASAVGAGNKQIQQQAAAEGKALSPSTLASEGQYTANAALQDYTQQETNAYNIFSNQEGRALGEQETLAGYGEQATGAINQAGQTASTNEGNLQLDIGNAQASGALGQATAINSGAGQVNQGLQQYLNSQYYSNLFNTNPSTSNFNSALNSAGSELTADAPSFTPELTGMAAGDF